MEDPKYSDNIERSEVVCKNCGAKLNFAPGTSSLECQYCGALNEIEVDEKTRAEATKEIDFDEFINSQVDAAPKQEVVTIKCEACGADTTFDQNVVSQDCAFCGSPLVVDNGQSKSLLQPKALLPFKIKDKEAMDMFKTWLKKLWWAPNKLKHYARSGKIAGVYIPYWTYDSNTNTFYRGERGDDYQETETFTNSEGETETRTVTKTNWRNVSGNVHEVFDDVLVPASQSLPRKYVEKLEPWDLDQLLPYDSKYLSGFKAESYQIGVKEGFQKAQNKMEVVIRNSINRDIGGDHQKIHSMNTNYNDTTFKHILLPLWISAYRFNNKTYRFLVNARTGEVQGERPYSWIKIVAAIIVVIAIIATIIYFASENG